MYEKTIGKLHRTEEFDKFIESCDILKDQKTRQELYYIILLAWSRGYDEGIIKGECKAKEEIHNRLFARKEMGG